MKRKIFHHFGNFSQIKTRLRNRKVNLYSYFTYYALRKMKEKVFYRLITDLKKMKSRKIKEKKMIRFKNPNDENSKSYLLDSANKTSSHTFNLFITLVVISTLWHFPPEITTCNSGYWTWIDFWNQIRPKIVSLELDQPLLFSLER